MHHKELEIQDYLERIKNAKPGTLTFVPEGLVDVVIKAQKKQNEKFCTVSKPEHYNKGDIECIDAIKASMSPIEFQGYLKGTVMKYLWRFRYKGKPLEDLQKDKWYLNKLIEEIECQNTQTK